MRTILAALLAICMAVFPVAMPQAAALTGHGHAPAAHAHNAPDCPEHANVPASEDVSAVGHEHASSPHQDDEGSSSCCGTTACHAFQVSSLPTLGDRPSLIGVVQVACDHQVPDVLSGRLDRPPRTV